MKVNNQLVIPENTSKNTHNVVAELLGEVANRKVLDLPCGEGAFTKRMIESGADVFSADFLNILRIPHGQFSVVDMNQRLPYAEAMFDAVVCIDGIEHIEDRSTSSVSVRESFGKAGCSSSPRQTSPPCDRGSDTC